MRRRTRVLQKNLAAKTLAADFYLTVLHFFDLILLYLRRPNNELAYYNLLFSVAMAANPKVILELGTGSGLSSLAFIRTLQYYRKRGIKQGILHTCDIDLVSIQRLRRFAGFDPLVIPHNMPSDELAAKWAQAPIPIDLLYIDADHSHEQSLADFQQFAPYVVSNGLILMHDTFPLTEEHKQRQYSGDVWKTAQYIKQHLTTEYEIMTMPYLCGISLLRKKGAKYF